jgi:hypothetical protein
MTRILRQLTQIRFRPGTKPLLLPLLALVSATTVIGVYLLAIGPRGTAAAELDLSLLAQAYRQASINGQALQGGSTRIIPGAAFVDDGYGDWSYGLTYGSAYISNYPDSTTFCMQAPVDLPDGAQINAFKAYVYDNNATGDIWRIELRRKPLASTAGSEAIASTATSGTAATLQTKVDNTITKPFVDNAHYLYFAAVCADGSAFGGVRLYALAVDFTHLAILPLAFQNYSYCVARPGGVESEPNENRDQANAICMGIPVTGNPNDSYPNAEFDWYKLEWNAQGTLQVDLTNFVADAQLILYKGTTELTKDFTPDVNNNFQVTYGGAAGPGTYYILATAGTSRPGPTAPDYTLTASVH